VLVRAGDCLAISKLIYKISLELKKNPKSAPDYQHLLIELEALDRALKHLQRIKPTQRELRRLDGIRALASTCQRPLEEFLAKIEKFEEHLGSWSASNHRIPGFHRRLQWSMKYEEEVKSLRAKLAPNVATITALLVTQTIDTLSNAESDRFQIARELNSKLSSQSKILADLKRITLGITTAQARLKVEKSYMIATATAQDQDLHTLKSKADELLKENVTHEIHLHKQEATLLDIQDSSTTINSQTQKTHKLAAAIRQDTTEIKAVTDSILGRALNLMSVATAGVSKIQDITTLIAQMIRLTTQFTTEMRETTAKLLRVFWGIQRQLARLERFLPKQIDSPVVRFRDAFNEMRPLPYDLSREWQKFQGLVSVIFMNRQGLHRVNMGQYFITNVRIGRRLNPTFWSNAIEPDDELSMTMILDDIEVEDGLCPYKSCGASTKDVVLRRGGKTCPNCHRFAAISQRKQTPRRKRLKHKPLESHHEYATLESDFEPLLDNSDEFEADAALVRAPGLEASEEEDIELYHSIQVVQALLTSARGEAGSFKQPPLQAPRDQLSLAEYKGREGQLEPAHPDTLKTVQNPAIVCGRYKEAEQLCERALKSREGRLGPAHPDTLATVQNLANIYRNQGRYNEAKQLCERALKSREEQLGPAHPDTLRTVQNLAIVYRNQGRYKEAEQLFERALKDREGQLGLAHSDTLRTVQNLAIVYSNQGRYKEAEQLYERALRGWVGRLGPAHSNTLRTLHNLANACHNQGRYNEAEQLYEQALRGREGQLGPVHPDTLTTVQNLANVYRNQGRYKEAEQQYERALRGREGQLRPAHPDTLTTMQNLANVYRNQGRYKEAEQLYKRALKDREEQLGPAHPDTLRTVQNLAIVYSNRGRYKEAEQLYERAREGWVGRLGPAHPDTLMAVQNLAIVYGNQGRYEEAEQLYEQALRSRERQLGPAHPDTLTTVQNLADVYRNQGRHKEAELLCERVLRGREGLLGPAHPDTLRTAQNLAIVYSNQGRYKEAEQLFERTLKGWVKQLGPAHPDTLRTVQNLAIVYGNQGRYKEAEQLYEQALKGREEQLGSAHPDTLRTMQNLAIVYRSQGRYKRAEQLFERALEGREAQLGPAHRDTQTTVQNLADVYRNQGRYKEAEQLCERALKSRGGAAGAGAPPTR
jgi:tetratricopeptide (TPR) repeat protein